MRKSLVLLCFLFLFKPLSAQWYHTNGPYGGWISGLIAFGGNVYAGTNMGLYVSSNNGISWSVINSGFTSDRVYFAANGTDLLAGTNFGVYISLDSGANWMASSNGLGNNKKIQAITKMGNNLYVGTYTAGVYVSTNNGVLWTPANSGIDSINILSLAVIGTNLYAGSYGNGAFMSIDSGSTWTPIGSILTLNVAGFFDKL